MSDPSTEHDTGLRPEEIDPEHPRAIETPWGAFALFRRGGTLRCVQAFCPHLEGPLFEGTLSGDEVTCPWHRWRFSLASGERLDAPTGPEPLAPARPDQRLSRLAVRTSARGTIVLVGPPRRGPAGV